MLFSHFFAGTLLLSSKGSITGCDQRIVTYRWTNFSGVKIFHLLFGAIGLFEYIFLIMEQLAWVSRWFVLKKIYCQNAFVKQSHRVYYFTTFVVSSPVLLLTSRLTVVSDGSDDSTRWLTVLLSFVSAVLLSTFILLFFPSSSVSLSNFYLAVPMRRCLGKHSCMSSPFPIAILNGTCSFRALILFCGDEPAIKTKLTVRQCRCKARLGTTIWSDLCWHEIIDEWYHLLI